MKDNTILKEWGGVFYPNSYKIPELRHTAWKGNTQRFGITGMVGWALPSYDGVSKKTLDDAAEFGSAVHDEIEAYLEFGGDADTKVLQLFKNVQDDNQLRFIRSEFVVSDGKFFASPIDMIADTPECADDEVILIDFKVTASRMEEKVALQLSLYAWMFEKQTGLKVKGIYHMWFKKEKVNDVVVVTDVEFNEVNRQSVSVLKQLIKEYRKCVTFKDLYEVEGKTVRAIMLSPSDTYTYDPNPKMLAGKSKRLDRAYQKYLQASLELEQLKEEFLLQMRNEAHVHSYKKDNMTVSYVQGKETSKFNSAAWKKDHPDEVEKYTTKSIGKSYITIKYGK